MKRLLALGFLGVFLLFSLTTSAWVHHLLNYQGRLTDDTGSPITTTTIIRFSLYQGGDATTPQSGTLVYEEDATVIPDSTGVFDHTIGSGSVVYGTLDATVFQTTSPVFLEITVDPAGLNETLLPRKQIVSVGYSFKSELADDADTLDGQHAAAFSPVGHHHDADYVNEGQANSVTSPMIVNGTIVDADIASGANIAASKINRTALDADLLDGIDSTGFVSTAGDSMTGTLSVITDTSYALYGANTATSGANFGVWGKSDSPGGRGVFGTAPNYGVYGEATASTGITYGVYGRSISNSGRGVVGDVPSPSGTTYGVCGFSASTSGYGVYGIAPASSGTTYGVYGRSYSNNGYGVYGYASATSGTNYGLWGISDSTNGTGVCGFSPATSGITYGVLGSSNSPDGTGVFGDAKSSSGINYGVYGQSYSTNGIGVKGHAIATSGTNYGVFGVSNSTDGRGVYGLADATSGGGYGVYGKSFSPGGRGVLGEATATSGANFGVWGKSDSPGGRGVFGTAPNYGVYGEATASTGITYGVYGRSISNSGRGVVGDVPSPSGTTYGVCGFSASTSGYGVYGIASASSGTTYGVYGRSYSSSGYAGYFEGNTHVTGDLTVDGSKTCVQPIANGKKVLLYAMESPEIWFEDFGTAKLVNGQALVQLESVFTQAANTEIGYFVFPIPNGECNGLYISRKDKDSFEVRELGDGTSSISFDYRIVAKRRGYEDVRFEEFTEPEQSPEEAKLPVETKAATKVKQRR